MTAQAAPEYVFRHREESLADLWRERVARIPAAERSLSHSAVFAIGDSAVKVNAARPLHLLMRPSTLRFAASTEPTHELTVHVGGDAERESFFPLEMGAEMSVVFQSETPEGPDVAYAGTFHALLRMDRARRRAEALLLYGSDGCSHRHALDVLLWVLLMETAGSLSCFFLHGTAAADAAGDSASVGCAVSGGGKTTFAQVLRWRAGRNVLSDECVAVYERGGRWMVSGTPFGGALRGGGEMPLKQFLLLEKKTVNGLRPCPPSEALARLATGIRVSHRDSEAHFRSSLDRLALALKAIPCYFLGFHPGERLGEFV